MSQPSGGAGHGRSGRGGGASFGGVVAGGGGSRQLTKAGPGPRQAAVPGSSGERPVQHPANQHNREAGGGNSGGRGGGASDHRGRELQPRSPPTLAAALESDGEVNIDAGTRAVLGGLGAAKAVCGFSIMGAGGAIRGRSTFTFTNTSDLRLCVCDEPMDPLGRAGVRGALLTDKLCEACYTGTEMLDFRHRLALGSTHFPWLIEAFALPLFLLAATKLLQRCGIVLKKGPRIASYATFLSLFTTVLMLVMGVDWGVFRNLCVKGHAFHERLRVELPVSDATYFDICMYSTQEQKVTVAIVATGILDLLVVATLTYIASMREHEEHGWRGQEFLTRIRVLAKNANPVRAFDLRRGLTMSRKFAIPGLLGRPSGASDDEGRAIAAEASARGRARGGSFGVGLSLGHFPGRGTLFGRRRTRGGDSDGGHDSEEREDLLETRRRISKRLARGGSRDLSRVGGEGDVELAAMRELARLDLELELGLSGEESAEVPRRRSQQSSGSKEGSKISGSSRSSRPSKDRSSRSRPSKESSKPSKERRGAPTVAKVEEDDEEEEAPKALVDPQLDLIFHRPVPGRRSGDAGGGGGAAAGEVPKMAPLPPASAPRAPPRPVALPPAPAAGVRGTASPRSEQQWDEGWEEEGDWPKKHTRTELGVPDFVGYALHLARSRDARAAAGEDSDSPGSDSSDEGEDEERDEGQRARHRGGAGGSSGAGAKQNKVDDDPAWARYARGGCGSSEGEGAESQDSLNDKALEESTLSDLFHKPVSVTAMMTHEV
mmetsp:Transcript_119546/g.381448  ORF Transcript_119546/g.381448 Transcript_119546/m.381448 type:complete len:774 (+) Transcript_119546:64-2385(+)